MKIGKDYKIESDTFNIILFKRMASRKSQKDYWLAIGFFATVEGALKALADMKVRESGLRDLETVVKKQDEIYRLIDSLRIRSEGWD